jgi:ribosomal protein L11 methyltransferase
MRKITFVGPEPSALEIERRLTALEGETAPPLAVSRFERPGGKLWSIEAYFDDVAEPFVCVVGDGLELTAAPAIEPIGDVDWVGEVERALAPVVSGPFLVHGPHDRAKAEGHLLAIEIEAGGAFGTAHHGSTEGMLSALGRAVPHLRAELGRPLAALDLGTGSGILAIAIAKLDPDSQVLATDIDAEAVAIARENAVKNGVSNRIETLTADGLAHPRLGPGAVFDLVAANILAGPLVSLAPAICGAMAPHGRIILSGLLNEQAPDVATAYASHGWSEAGRLARGEWATLTIARQRQHQ